jgi:predicted nucleotidyltransferase
MTKEQFIIRALVEQRNRLADELVEFAAQANLKVAELEAKLKELETKPVDALVANDTPRVE